MPRRVLPLAALALVGCAAKPSEPKVVTLPPGLARPREGEAIKPPAPNETPASPAARNETGARNETSVRPTASATPARPVPSGGRPARPEAVVRRLEGTAVPTRVAIQTGSAPFSMPKADETRRLGYRIEGSGAVELEGVCRFSETEIACWDGDGKDAPDLKAQIESVLNQDGGGSTPLNLRFAHKNRIVVIRKEQMPGSGSGTTKSLNVTSVGTDPRQSGGYLNLPSGSPSFDAKTPFVTHEARMIAFDRDAQRTQMRVTVSESIPNPPELALRKGASVAFAGCRFTVTSIRKGVPPGAPTFGSDLRDVWSATVTQTGKPPRPASFAVQDYGRFFRDENGKIVDAQTYRKWMEQASRKGGFDYSKQPFRPIQISSFTAGPGGAMTVTMNADPAQIKTVHLYGSYLRTVDVTGIPLDPR